MPTSTVALIGTLDTKGLEYQWVADELVAHGVRVVVIDAGVAEPRGFSGTVDYSQESVAQAGEQTSTSSENVTTEVLPS